MTTEGPEGTRRSGRTVALVLFALAGIGLIALAVRVYGGG